jgi:hypothetical protein
MGRGFHWEIVFTIYQLTGLVVPVCGIPTSLQNSPIWRHDETRKMPECPPAADGEIALRLQ